MKTLLLLTAFLLTVELSFSQSSDISAIIDEIMNDFMSEGFAEGIDPTSYFDDLLSIAQFPVDINSAGEEEFTKFHFLSELQISNILNYRINSGPFITIYELQYVEGVSFHDLRRLTPFISAGEESFDAEIFSSDILRKGNHQYFLRLNRVLQNQRGYNRRLEDEQLSSYYKGSPIRIYTRYQYNYFNKIQAGIVSQKDPGEQFFKGNNPYGFDYHTVHLQINDLGKLKTLALGDYQISIGQGLIMWSGLSFGKSANVLNIRKNPRGIQKYSSTDENRFFRGIGLTYKFSENSEGSFFISRKNIDATVSKIDESGEILEVSALPNTGLHATDSQIEGKNVLGESILGLNLAYNSSALRLGFTFAAYGLDATLNPPERVYNLYEFRGSANFNGGVDYQFLIQNIRFFGEAALSRNGGYAILNGAMVNLSSRISLSLLHRKYSPNYQALQSNGFRENTRTSNESGFYFGTVIYPVNKFELSFYIDFYRFPWARYSAYAPSSGVDYLARLDYTYSRAVNMYLYYRSKSKPVNSPSSDSQIREIIDSSTSRLRYHLSVVVSPLVELRSRVEWCYYVSERSSRENGFMIYQDLIFRPRTIPYSAALRLAMFETDTYNARFYAYENDVLYSFSTPSYYDSGYRFYLLNQYSVNKNLDIWLRYGFLKLPGRESIGSGMNLSPGDVRSDVKFQLRLKF